MESNKLMENENNKKYERTNINNVETRGEMKDVAEMNDSDNNSNNHSDSDTDYGEDMGDISKEDIQTVIDFQKEVQLVKTRIYENTVKQQEETTDGTNLDGLHKYEFELYSIGSCLLKALIGINNNIQNKMPVKLWKMVNDVESSDARILIENEIRNQFIQYPFVRKSNQTILLG